ncbi:DddA-like double-stranded DNA deaminase toxin [Amycolatopsis sp. NPDC005232]|uniref:DddA-like double-stranded DNA deaminase toxin n=1 Tax=Amycolatopsis sp. NPDC005232 TaxID=3157027 RepID=UPI0033B83CB6
MSAFTDLIARLRATTAKLPTGPVARARDAITTELVPELARLSAGSSSDVLTSAVNKLASLATDLDRVLALLSTAHDETENWIGARSDAAPRSQVSARKAGSGAPTQPTSVRVAEYRARLEHPWPYGRPLRGWRLAPVGATTDQELTSGTKQAAGEADPAYTAAVEKARALGLSRSGFAPDIARHIEIKEAATMLEGETRTIVIGKDPCGIDPVTNVSCHRFLRYFLPVDATLIVYGPAGKPHRYEGKRTS